VLLLPCYLLLCYRNYSLTATDVSNCVHRRNEIMEKRLKRVNPFCVSLLLNRFHSRTSQVRTRCRRPPHECETQATPPRSRICGHASFM
jgi:hypothetical protein